uniref:Uncharacterized protein n=1 Tax=Rhizophora mucronata TaxID=61149 RepID=A0A2P2PJ00_RHIMU
MKLVAKIKMGNFNPSFPPWFNTLQLIPLLANLFQVLFFPPLLHFPFLPPTILPSLQFFLLTHLVRKFKS